MRLLPSCKRELLFPAVTSRLRLAAAVDVEAGSGCPWCWWEWCSPVLCCRYCACCMTGTRKPPSWASQAEAKGQQLYTHWFKNNNKRARKAKQRKKKNLANCRDVTFPPPTNWTNRISGERRQQNGKERHRLVVEALLTTVCTVSLTGSRFRRNWQVTKPDGKRDSVLCFVTDGFCVIYVHNARSHEVESHARVHTCRRLLRASPPSWWSLLAVLCSPRYPLLLWCSGFGRVSAPLTYFSLVRKRPDATCSHRLWEPRWSADLFCVVNASVFCWIHRRPFLVDYCIKL